MDSDYIKEGDTFEDLPVIYVIFFTENDIFKEGRATYKVEPFLTHNKKRLNMDVHIIFVNGQYKGTNEIGKLIFDMWQTDPKKIHSKTLSERAKFIKNLSTEEGKAMAGQVLKKYQAIWFNEGLAEGLADKEECVKQGMEQGIQQGTQQTSIFIEKTMLKKQMSLDTISECTGVPFEELQALQSEERA